MMQQRAIEKSEDAPAQTTDPIKTRTRLILALIITAGFLDVIDFSIVQVALPTIQTELVVSLAESQWIIGAYGLTLAGFLLLSGRAGDIYGQKKLFVFGIVLFTVASFSGGVLTAAFGWRSVLFVNVPIGIVAAVLSQKFLVNHPGRALDKHLDLPGALAVTSGLVLLVYALTNAATDGFVSVQTILPLGLSAVVLAGFVAIEYRSQSPLMPLAFLRRGTVFTANVLALLLTASAGGVVFILTTFLQQVSGYSALAAGLEFVPAAMIFFFVGGFGSSRLVNRFGLKLVLVTSMTLITLGSALLTQITVNSGYVGVLPGMLIWSLGASIGSPALNIAALAGTKPGEEGLASGIIGTSQRVGFPLGLAILLTIASVTDPPPIGTAGPSASLVGIVTGFQYAFLASTIISAIGLLIALRVKNQRMMTEQPFFS